LRRIGGLVRFDVWIWVFACILAFLGFGLWVFGLIFVVLCVTCPLHVLFLGLLFVVMFGAVCTLVCRFVGLVVCLDVRCFCSVGYGV